MGHESVPVGAVKQRRECGDGVVQHSHLERQRAASKRVRPGGGHYLYDRLRRAAYAHVDSGVHLAATDGTDMVQSKAYGA